MRQYINLDDGTRLAYTVSGEGKPMILMHGWGCNADTLASVEKTAAESHRVYNIDFPGFGQSPEPAQVWGVDEYTRALEGFVRRLGIEKPVLLGHSFGGRVGILYSSRNPVDRLVLVDAAGVKPRRSPGYYVKVYSFKFMKLVYRLIYGKVGAAKRIEAERARRGSADYQSASPRMRAILSKVLIYGENDTATPVRDAKKIESLVPDAGLVVFPGCGHYSFLDNPYQFAAVLRSFLTNEK